MTNVLGGLRTIVQTGPQNYAENSRHAQGTSVMSQPSKIQRYFYAKIFGNIVQRLGSEQFSNPIQLQFTQCRRLV